MKKNTWIGVMIVGILVILGAYFVGQNSRQGQKNLMQLQDNCHKWADTILANNKFGASSNLQSFTHYNTSLGKCFVEVKSFRSSNDGSFISYDDVYDGEKGALIFDNFTSNSIQNSLDYRPVNGVTSATTITNDQFSILRDQYMNN